MGHKPSPRIPGEPASGTADQPAGQTDDAQTDDAQTAAAAAQAQAELDAAEQAERERLAAEALEEASRDSAELLADKDAEIADLRKRLRDAQTAGRDKRDNADLPPQNKFKGQPLPRAVLTEDGWLAPTVPKRVVN